LKDKPVVCDRYIYSTVATHKPIIENFEFDISESGLRIPNKTFLLVTDTNVRIQRLMARNEQTRFELDLEYQERSNIEFLKQ
jgi:thymidylate kinase